MRRSLALAVGVLCAIGFALVEVPPYAAQSPSVEYQVKAAFLFNFAQFVQWPTQAFPAQDTPFTICLAGDPFAGALEKTVAGEKLNGRRIVLKQLSAADRPEGCHLVYVSPSETKRTADIIKAVGKTPVLTVGDSEDFISSGGMIRFTELAHRVRFEINPDAANRASLRVSSRLLRLADIVRPRQRAANP
jgi:hypothetical protein